MGGCSGLGIGWPVTIVASQPMEPRLPHIGRATVTYLYSGALIHRDSLGHIQRVDPGAIDLMAAGRGIVHSERVTFGNTDQDTTIMFDTQQASGYRELLPSIRQKTRVFGKNTLLAEFRLSRGSVLPAHAHPYEQTGYLVDPDSPQDMTRRILELLARPEERERMGRNGRRWAAAFNWEQAVEVVQAMNRSALSQPT